MHIVQCSQMTFMRTDVLMRIITSVVSVHVRRRLLQFLQFVKSISLRALETVDGTACISLPVGQCVPGRLASVDHGDTELSVKLRTPSGCFLLEHSNLGVLL